MNPIPVWLVLLRFSRYSVLKISHCIPLENAEVVAELGRDEMVKGVWWPLLILFSVYLEVYPDCEWTCVDRICGLMVSLYRVKQPVFLCGSCDDMTWFLLGTIYVMVSHVPLSSGPKGMVGIFRCVHVSLKEENRSDNAAVCAATTVGSEYFALNSAIRF